MTPRASRLCFPLFYLFLEGLLYYVFTVDGGGTSNPECLTFFPSLYIQMKEPSKILHFFMPFELTEGNAMILIISFFHSHGYKRLFSFCLF